jgi:hypothetical protein
VPLGPTNVAEQWAAKHARALALLADAPSLALALRPTCPAEAAGCGELRLLPGCISSELDLSAAERWRLERAVWAAARSKESEFAKLPDVLLRKVLGYVWRGSPLWPDAAQLEELTWPLQATPHACVAHRLLQEEPAYILMKSPGAGLTVVHWMPADVDQERLIAFLDLADALDKVVAGRLSANAPFDLGSAREGGQNPLLCRHRHEVTAEVARLAELSEVVAGLSACAAPPVLLTALIA